MMRIGWRSPLGTFLLAAALLATPGILHAQEEPDSAAATAQARADSLSTLAAESEVPRDEMETYVALELAVDELQEAAIQEMASVHAEAGRSRIRTNLTADIDAAHEEHGFTRERARRITFLVSSDAAVRALFQMLMQAAQGEGAAA